MNNLLPEIEVAKAILEDAGMEYAIDVTEAQQRITEARTGSRLTVLIGCYPNDDRIGRWHAGSYGYTSFAAALYNFSGMCMRQVCDKPSYPIEPSYVFQPDMGNVISSLSYQEAEQFRQSYAKHAIGDYKYKWEL